MTTTLLVLSAVVMIVLVELARRRRIERRKDFLAQLTALSTSLGHVIGRMGDTRSTLEGFDGGALVLRIDDKTLRIDVAEALEVQREPDAARRTQRLRHLVDRERIRQGV